MLYIPSQAYLVVIHDGVEGLDPHGINVAIQHNPLGSVARHVAQVTHDHREQAWKKTIQWFIQYILLKPFAHDDWDLTISKYLHENMYPHSFSMESTQNLDCLREVTFF